jgi:hypothetical protein
MTGYDVGSVSVCLSVCVCVWGVGVVRCEGVDAVVMTVNDLK